MPKRPAGIILRLPVQGLLVLIIVVTISSCSVSRKYYRPDHYFTQAELRADYSLLRKILEQKHPSLYWYTSKDSMDFYFDSLYNQIADSMTELQFGWKIVAPLSQKIHCGHTSFGMSKAWGRYIRNKTIPSFPLYCKVWNDTIVVLGSLNRSDSSLKRGTLITSINGMKNHAMLSKLFGYLPTDGYATNVNYSRLSNSFPYYHRNVFGLYKNYTVGYIDSTGKEQNIRLGMYSPDTSKAKDSIKRIQKRIKEPGKKQWAEAARFLTIDSTRSTGILTIHTFSNGEKRHLRKFLRRSFQQLADQKIKHLIIDIRSNGGGDVGVSTVLTRYIRNSKFKIGDTVYSKARGFAPFTKYVNQAFWANIGLRFITHRSGDGNFHFGFYERHWFYPKKKNHFNGNVYVLINGPTFSASTLFCNSVKGQSNVLLVGEETGGGWYGNNGLLIPDITLPNTGLRMRLPFFRLVQFNHIARNGTGVIPDVPFPPSLKALREGVDRKMAYVMEQIDLQNKSVITP